MPKSAPTSLGIVAPAPIPKAQRSGPHAGASEIAFWKGDAPCATQLACRYDTSVTRPNLIAAFNDCCHGPAMSFGRRRIRPPCRP